MMVWPLRLSDHRPRVFIIAQSDEFRMSQMVSVGPLNKLNPRHGLRFQPQCRMRDYAAWVFLALSLPRSASFLFGIVRPRSSGARVGQVSNEWSPMPESKLTPINW